MLRRRINGEILLATTQWTADTNGVVIICEEMRQATNEMGRVHIVKLPMASQAPVRTIDLPDQTLHALVTLLCGPPAMVGQQLFLGGNGIRRIDLITGKCLEVAQKEFFLLFSHEGDVYYLNTGVPLHTPLGDNELGDIELGTLNAANLRQTPVLNLKEEILGAISPRFSINKDKAQIAVISEKAGDKLLWIYRNRKLVQRLTIGPRAQAGHLGNTVCSPDGGTIYAAYARDLPNHHIQLGILEISLSGAPLRDIPLIQQPDKMPSREKNDWALEFEIVLSPDGQCIAAVPPVDRDETPILYLVDLKNPVRRVAKTSLIMPK